MRADHARRPLALGALVACGAVIVAAAASGCACESGPRDAGPRRDVGPRIDAGGGGDEDGGGGGRLDAWLDPTLDADLDAWIDPRTIDAATDANQDVGPIDAFEHDAGGGGTGDAGGGGGSTDAGRARDTGPDARPPTGACGILWDRGDPLPEECLPRCSRDTRDLFEGCFGDAVCEAYVMVRDTSRTGLLYVWDDRDVTEVDCEACVGTQRFSCWHVRCADQANDWVDCVSVRMAEACMREKDTLDRCLAPYRSEVEACFEARVPLCFPE